jgi:histidine ammonia-lyase
MSERETILLGRAVHDLTIDELVRIARDPRVRVGRAEGANERIDGSYELVASLVRTYRDAWERGQPVPGEYGVTTGFGEFKDKSIPPEELLELQRNLLLSHSVGVGENTNRDDLSNYFPPEVVRAALAIRLNTFLKGHSGVRRVLVDIVEAMLNCGVIPLVPLRGSVGASGDLCPLSHLFVGLLEPDPDDPRELGRFLRVFDAAEALSPKPTTQPMSKLLVVLQEELPHLTRQEMQPSYKEGLALNNGANFSSGMLALAVYDARVLVRTADVAVAMTLQALGGCTRAFDPRVHEARPHPGQKITARRILELLAGSRLAESAGAVQDAYSLRCSPQVHGATRDTIEHAAGVAEREINSATDNPLFFLPDGRDPCDWQFRENWPAEYDGTKRVSYSAGNFHGQPIAIAADSLAIAIAELANISERRTQMLLDEHHNRNLPPNLTTRAGVNSGFMIAQYTAAGLVSENKVLSHPASVDSIPTSANSEDHVSMSTHAARKMRTILGNTQSVVAIELLAASQAVEWRVALDIPARRLRDDEDSTRYRPKDVAGADRQKKELEEKVRAGAEKITASISTPLRPIYRQIRAIVPPLFRDRPLDEDLRLVRTLVAGGVLAGEN